MDITLLVLHHYCAYSLYFYITRTDFTLRLRNDLYCVEWGVKLYSLTHVPTSHTSTVPAANEPLTTSTF